MHASARALFQPIYIEEYISGILYESEFQERKKIGNPMAGYFLCFMVFFFVGLFFKLSFFKVWRYVKKSYSIVFHGRGTELLEIYSSMAERVGNIKNILLNNFKMVKSTKNIKIHIIHEFNPLTTRQNLAEISRNQLCHPLHNQKKNTRVFSFVDYNCL